MGTGSILGWELRFHKLCATARKEKILSGVLSVSQNAKVVAKKKLMQSWAALKKK